MQLYILYSFNNKKPTKHKKRIKVSTKIHIKVEHQKYQKFMSMFDRFIRMKSLFELSMCSACSKFDVFIFVLFCFIKNWNSNFCLDSFTVCLFFFLFCVCLGLSCHLDKRTINIHPNSCLSLFLFDSYSNSISIAIAKVKILKMDCNRVFNFFGNIFDF